MIRLAGAAGAVACVIACVSPKRAEAVSAQLSFGVAAVSFPGADPDMVPVIGAVENPVDVEVRIRADAGIVAQLTALAGGDLVSGPDRIAIDQVRWTGEGSGFLSGVFSATEPQLVGQWVGKTDAYGNLRFWLTNSWEHPSGVYSQTVVYTLVAY